MIFHIMYIKYSLGFIFAISATILTITKIKLLQSTGQSIWEYTQNNYLNHREILNDKTREILATQN